MAHNVIPPLNSKLIGAYLFSQRYIKRLFCGAVLVSSLFSVTAVFSADADFSEYDAVLSLDEATFEQLSDGWHGGLAVDNAIHPDDGDANFSLDARYQQQGRRFLSQWQVASDEICRAGVRYAHPLFSSESTLWRAVADAGYEHDRQDNSDIATEFEDSDTSASLALEADHQIDVVALTALLQSRWRRFERSGDIVVLDEPSTLDVQKDFRSLEVALSARWRVARFEHSLWAVAAHITDMDVSACLDQICLLTDAVEDNFNLYEFLFDQTWHLTAQHEEGVSLKTLLTGYTSSADHLPSNYQFSIGGMYSVRGYDEGIAGGDEAAFLRNELRLPWQTTMAMFAAGRRQHGYLFYDWGMVWQHAVEITVNDSAFELLPEASTRLSAAGVGIDLELAHAVSLRFEYAVALAAIGGLADKGDTSLHAGIDWRAF